MTSVNMPKGWGGREKFEASRLNANLCGVNGGRALSWGSIDADPGEKGLSVYIRPSQPRGRRTWRTNDTGNESRPADDGPWPRPSHDYVIKICFRELLCFSHISIFRIL